MKMLALKPIASLKTVLGGCVLCLFVLIGDGADVVADQPVVIFQSPDDVRQAIARWDAEDRDPYDSDKVIEVQMVGNEPTLGIKLDENPLGPEVEAVVAGSAAAKAGMKKGDHLLSIGNAKIESMNDAAALVARHPVGTVMDLKFRRNNYTYERRIRFLSESEASDEQRGSLVYLRDRVEELERQLTIERTRNLRLREAVRYLLSAQPATP
jgi:S1-C subfamily serine protease